MAIRDLIRGRKQEPQEAHPVDVFQKEMNRLFEGFFSGWDLVHREFSGAFSPRVEVTSTDKEVLVSAELPGVDGKQVHVTLDNDALTISGEKVEEHTEDKDGVCRSERTYGRFQRTIALPCEVNEQGVTAEHRNGVLKIRLPRKPPQETRARRIEVTSAG